MGDPMRASAAIGPPSGAPEGAGTASGVVRVLEVIGASVQAALETVGISARFGAQVARAGADVRTWLAELPAQMRLLGVESMPIASFIALFTGVVIALLASCSLTGATVPLYFIGTSAEKAIMMELAPVLTGLALAGRVGANIAAELGTMRVTEQVDALQTLAY